MRSLLVVLFKEPVKALLLEYEILRRRTRRLGFERAMHALVRAVLLGVAGDDPFDPDAEPDLP